MILIEEQEVLDVLGLSQRQGNQSTAIANLRTATTQIENHLGTSLTRTERIDYFGLPRNIQGPLQVPAYLLNLTQGFIDQTATFEVFYSNDGEPILDIADANAELQTADAYDINWKLGRLTLYGTTTVPSVPFRGIAVHYTAGFEVDDHDVAQNVDKGLKDGAIAYALYNMRANNFSHTSKQPFKSMQDQLRREFTGLLSPYIRPRTVGDEPQYQGTV